MGRGQAPQALLEGPRPESWARLGEASLVVVRVCLARRLLCCDPKSRFRCVLTLSGVGLGSQHFYSSQETLQEESQVAWEGGGDFLPLLICKVHPCPVVSGLESSGVGEA